MKFKAGLASIAGALAIAAGSVSAATITMSSTVAQSGFFSDTTSSMPLTDPSSPFDFAGQGYQNLNSIDKIGITLTMFNGMTDTLESDNNNLTLALDGIDTGLKLNGFLGGQLVTLTLEKSGLPVGLLAALKSDGKLVGTIIDSTPGDHQIGLSARVDTTLDITGSTLSNGGGGTAVPLPAAALLAPLGAGIAGMASRRIRAKK